MKFNNVIKEAGELGIQEPTLSAYLAQIKDLQNKAKSADPNERIQINKQIAELRRQMQQKKQEAEKQIQQKQQQLAKANTIV